MWGKSLSSKAIRPEGDDEFRCKEKISMSLIDETKLLDISEYMRTNHHLGLTTTASSGLCRSHPVLSGLISGIYHDSLITADGLCSSQTLSSGQLSGPHHHQR